jgi:hypothetical protein
VRLVSFLRPTREDATGTNVQHPAAAMLAEQCQGCPVHPESHGEIGARAPREGWCQR